MGDMGMENPSSINEFDCTKRTRFPPVCPVEAKPLRLANYAALSYLHLRIIFDRDLKLSCLLLKMAIRRGLQPSRDRPRSSAARNPFGILGKLTFSEFYSSATLLELVAF